MCSINLHRKPWSKNETVGDDIDTLNVKENINRISKNFCNWLRRLPGEDESIMLSENDVKSMFDVSDEEQTAENLDRLHEEKIHRHWSKVALSVKFLDARFR